MTEEELPSGWARATLADVTSFISRGRSPRYTDEAGVPVINQRCVRWTGIDERFLKFTEEAAVATLREEYILQPGDVLWNSTGTGTIGRAAVYIGLASDRPAVVDTHVTVVRPEGYQPRLLHYWIMSSAVQDQIEEMQTGSTNQVELPRKVIEATAIPVPPADEQRRIVERIDELFSQIEAGESALARAKKLLERYRQAVLKAAVTGELTKDWRERHQAELEPADHLLTRILQARRKAWEKAELEKLRAKGKAPKDDKWKQKYKEPKPPDKSELPELPEGWVWASWAQIGFSQNGKPFPSKDYQSDGIRLMRPGNLAANGRAIWTEKNTACLPHSWLDERPELLLHVGDLVMNLTAQSLADEFLGRVCLLSESDSSLLNQRLARLTPVLMDRRFCLYVFKSRLFRTFVESGLNSGSLIQHMFTSQVERFPFTVPPQEEQKQIAQACELCISTIEHASAEIADQERRAAALRQSILTAAFAGKLVPQDPADEPAAALLERIRAERAAPSPRRRGRLPTSAAGSRTIGDALPPVSGHAVAETAGGDRS